MQRTTLRHNATLWTDDSAQLQTPAKFQSDLHLQPRWRRAYLSVPFKYFLALLAAIAWAGVSIWLSLPWLDDLSRLIGQASAIAVIALIAYVPGFMNAFLITSIGLDRRPYRLLLSHYPSISILVACYNEEAHIADTLRSLAAQHYPGIVEIIILDDGSTDNTTDIARTFIEQAQRATSHRFRLVTGYRNVGKAGALNRGLALAEHDLVATVDGDSWLHANALRRITERYVSDPPNTRAVAGSIAVRNSRKNLLTRMQEWDYFHGIAAVKRMQSMYHGTLVAQGAFSLYHRATLQSLGGWPECVGEDIVLSWAILKAGHRIGYAEDALLFTNAPDTLKQFARQRQRWSRGLVEAFLHHGALLFKPRMSTLFIWWNLLFLPMDLAYSLIFIPGVVAAFFGYYFIAGPMTLAILPLALLWNGVIFSRQKKMFKEQGLRVRRNVSGFLSFVFGYSLVLQPVCVWGYAAELLGARKHWGTK